jgi:transposase InsO family protein
MHNEFSNRQQAVRMRLAGEPILHICNALHRSPAWVRKWWQRYVASGGEGLFDLTRAPATLVNRISPQLERAILTVRRRLMAHATPETRYALMGAPTIREELRTLGYSNLPALRTIERVLQRAHLTSPRLRLARRLPDSTYPGPQAHDSNELHEVDLVGPRYLKGDKTKYYFAVCKDAFDQAVYAEFLKGNGIELLMPFLIRAWQQLGLPQYVQFDNGRAFYGWGRWPRSVNRLLRLVLRLGVHPVFIPEARPQRNGAVENFNGWFQPLLLRRPFPFAAAVRHELRRLLLTVNTQHVHQALGFKTVAQYRRGKRLRKLPANFTMDLNDIPVTAGKITFIRWVLPTGRIDVLGESVKVGRQRRFRYARVTLDTRRQLLKIYLNGHLISQTVFKLRIG